jgi:drug/metabolite transporter (DMT)-like permease
VTPYLLTLASSLIYVAAALFMKRAIDAGAGVWRVTVVTNVYAALVFLVLLPLGGQIPRPFPWHQPAAAAALFLAGQLLALVSLRRGDVSVATPVLGLKVVLVAFFVTALLGERVPLPLWFAAVLSSAGILFLNRRTSSSHAPVGPAIVYGGLAAAAFGLFDVLVQKWSPAWGAGRFLPLTMGLVAAATLAIAPLTGAWREVLPPEARRAMRAGGPCMAVQAVMLIASIGIYGKATAINVIYSARGLWSVLAVWWVGHWFANRERERGADVFRSRLLGAALLLAAIALAVLGR